MRIYEVATVERISAVDLAQKIVRIYNMPNPTVSDYRWLLAKSEDEYAKHIINRALGKNYVDTYRLDDVDFYELDRASTLAQALNILNTVEHQINLRAKSEIKQSTDEFLNSEEIKQLAKEKAYVDLQNAYADKVSKSEAHVSSLASLAVDI